QRLYGQFAETTSHEFTPLDIFNIAEGILPGNQGAAQKSFAVFGEVAGSLMAYCACILDGIIVLGGGLTGAHKYFMPTLLKELRADLYKLDGTPIPKVPSYIFDLDEEAQWIPFAQGERKEVEVYGSKRKVVYDPQKRLGIIRSKMGASDAVAIGAYAYALNHI
ncbi:MAG: ROK family protein, partial [Bacteroidales bacterium]|nr:ROK family protein [Bacteroidales bacterium]